MKSPIKIILEVVRTSSRIVIFGLGLLLSQHTLFATVDVQPLNVTPGSGSVTPGGSLYVSWQIRNNGSSSAGSSYSQVRITTSSSSYGSSANNVGSGVATGTIGAGATINQNETVTVPSSPGTYYVWVIADNTSLLTQTTVANDEAVSSSFTITGGSGGTDILGADFNADAGSINWSQEISSAPNFLIIKAAQGNNPNSFLPSNMSSAPAVTSSFTFGLYDYADPDEYANPSTMVTDPSNSGQVIADAHAAADSYYQKAKTYLTSGHLQPALDIEDDLNSAGTALWEGGFNIRSYITGAPVWTWPQIAEWIAAWTTELQQDLKNDGGPTVAPILYMSQSYAQNLSPSLINSYLTSTVAFQLWVVDISDSPAIDPSPSIGSWPTWAIEQYDWIGGDWDALNSSITLNSLEIQTQTTGGGSSPMISSPKLTGTTFTLSVPTQIGFNYTLEYKNSFSDASWTAVQTIGGTGGTITLTDTGATGSSRLYHVRVQSQ